MKILIYAIMSVGLLALSSCGVNSSIIVNHNQNSTQVQLTEKNYRVLGEVTGTAEVQYICAIGGMRRRQLYENAYADMMKHAELPGGSKAVINMVTEEHIGGVPPFYFKRTVTMSAYVIEFTQ